ncbi:MAG: 4-alpha-glucanotransferase [Spirochaetaceae bacterium]|jgi:4-alpha-glucanotransferase|nr:4-alpha-glucanotransferase [Spirochaetaceae bacterium]
MAGSQQESLSKKRLIGAVVPVGALRTERSIGVGEFPDLAEFAALCAEMGVGLIQLLPVNDTGYQSSPYFALTAFALHPLYLRIGDLPELKGPSSAEYAARLEALRGEFEAEVRYPFEKIIRAKIDMLRHIYAANKGAIAEKARGDGPLGRWIQENPWVREFAVYRRLKEANAERSWKEWSSHRELTPPVSPERLPPEIEALWNDKTLWEEHLFWVWVQEALDLQFREAAAAVAKAGILLEGDLPILMNEDCCDVWAHPEYFHGDLSAGAPPDMYSPDGQNWGFPTYNWEALAKEDYAWWRRRLEAAEKYYRAYRIDHVLGFFRIWSTGRGETSSALGRFIPYVPIKEKDLVGLGYDAARIRWLSRPHIPTGEVWDSLRANWGGPFNEGDIAAEAERVFTRVLDRIGSEELWLFKDSIKGEKDINALELHPAARACLVHAWHNRTFLEYEKGLFSPVWYYRFSRSYASLSDEERQALEGLLDKRRQASERIWEEQGKQLLSVLTASSSMLACAEDLGAVPDCVPRVLTKLKILGLRVVRWFRDWGREGQPYIPFEEYPELSVCTPAVHDSSTLREWWEREADQEGFCSFIGVPSLPKVYNPGTAKIILSRTAGAVSRFRVFQIQDLLHLSPKWYAEDPGSERINVPGTYNDFNWTYRLPATVGELGRDTVFIQGVKELAAVQPVKKKKK